MSQDFTSEQTKRNKKAIVTKKQERPPRTKVFIAIVFFLMLAAGVSYYAGIYPLSEGKTSPTATASRAETNASDIRYALAAFSDGQARYYSYNHQGLTIRYFILRSSDGVIRAAFDACDVCWPAGKGYAQDGDSMVCRNCGRRFASVRVNEVQGGCNPAPLTRTVQGNQLVIRVQDILGGQRYFNFKEKV